MIYMGDSGLFPPTTMDEMLQTLDHLVQSFQGLPRAANSQVISFRHFLTEIKLKVMSMEAAQAAAEAAMAARRRHLAGDRAWEGPRRSGLPPGVLPGLPRPQADASPAGGGYS